LSFKHFFLLRHGDECRSNAFSKIVIFLLALWIRNSLDSYHIEEKNKQNSPFKNQNSAILRKTGDLFLQKFGVCLVYFLIPALPQKNGNIFVFIHTEEKMNKAKTSLRVAELDRR